MARKSRVYAEAYLGTPHKETRRLTQPGRKKALSGWKLAKEIISAIGKDKVLTEIEELSCYSYDCSTYQRIPELVVLAKTTADVVAVLKVAHRQKVPVVPRGNATNLCGATAPLGGGIVPDVLSMNKILEIDKENLTATCQPGVITADFQNAVEAEGLFYPPDPASLQFCTLGGNVAFDSGGPRAVKYGVARNYVLGLETVLANGQILRTGGKTTKDVSGYNLTQLLVGSGRRPRGVHRDDAKVDRRAGGQKNSYLPLRQFRRCVQSSYKDY